MKLRNCRSVFGKQRRAKFIRNSEDYTRRFSVFYELERSIWFRAFAIHIHFAGKMVCTGVGIDCGYTTTSICPVYEGMIVSTDQVPVELS